MQIIITGMHRSGTSCIAGLIHSMGAYFAPEHLKMPVSPENPKGFWERIDVMELNDAILQAAGGSWCQVSDLSLQSLYHALPKEIHEKVMSVLASLDAKRPWFIKDPRLCLTFPIWSLYLENPLLIFVYRNPLQIIDSLKRRNNFPRLVGLALWEYYLVSIQNFLESQKHKTIFLNYEYFIDTPVITTYHLYKQLQSMGLESLSISDESKIHSYIDPMLFHRHACTRNLQTILTENQQKLNEYFFQLVNGTEEKLKISKFQVTEESSELLKLYFRSLNLLTGNTQFESLIHDFFEFHQQSFFRQSSERVQIKDQLSSLCLEKKVLEKELRRTDSMYIDQLTELQQQLRKQDDKIAQCESWLKEIMADVQDIFSSFRWKTGDCIIRFIEKMMFRRSQKGARHHLLEIFQEITNRHSVIFKQNRHMASFEKEDPASSWDLFCQMTGLALKNPRQTKSLINIERLKNLYITLFKAPFEIKRNVFEHYIQIYQKKSTFHLKNLLSQMSHSMVRTKSEHLLLDQVQRNRTVSIIIPAFNQWDFTKACIQSVKDSVKGLIYEIILADDHSTDETINASAYFQEVKVVSPPRNCGFLMNCNYAAKHANGGVLVFLNNDTLVHEGWLHAMLDVLEKDPNAGMVGSKLIYPDGSLQEAGGIIWNDATGWNYGRLDDPTKPEYNYLKEVDYFSGASFMIRTDVWHELGGFDERFIPAYYEDTDLAFRVREKGFKVVYTPFSEVTHFEGQSHGLDEFSGIKHYQSVNRVKFRERWFNQLKAYHFQNAEHLFLARDRSRWRKTMLVIDHYVPFYDQDAGSRSTYQYLQFFIESGLCIKFIGDNFYQHEPYTSALQQLGIEVLYGPWYQKNWRQWLEENGLYFDYVYLHRPHIAPKYIPAIKKYTKAKIIYFGHDLHQLRLNRQYQLQQDKHILKLALEWKEKEYKIYKEVDVICYPSIVETAEVFRQCPEKCVKTIPLHMYDEIVEENHRWKERDGLLFVGGFNHPPNHDAVIWFAKEIFPLIFSRDSSIQFSIVGAKIPSAIRELASDTFHVYGHMSDDDLKKMYKKSKIAVIPLRFGAGIKGKVLEALYMQIPVVTTEIGAEGFLNPEKYLKIATTPHEFAQKVLELYHDYGHWKSLVREGITYLNVNYSKKVVHQIWDEIFSIP